MLSVLKNLFFPSPDPRERPACTPRDKVRPDKKPKSTARPAGISAREIDTAFYGLILGVQSPIDSTLNTFEKKVLRELDQLLASDISHSSLVPRLPSVIPRVMGALRDESSSAVDLAAQLGRDAVLVSEVIRLANSPYYRVGKEITSLERAVFILGQVGVRQLVTNAAFKPLLNLNSGHFTKLSGTILWDQSEKAAVICDCLARQEKTDRFNAYLMAIVQNAGFTVALQILDRNFDGSQAPRSGIFHERLISRSRKLSWIIAKEWEFGPAVLDALEAQIKDRNMPITGNILYVADKLSKMSILSGRGRFKGDVDQLAERLQERLTRPCKDCFEKSSG
ncbi:MAG TPA: HDOD domain-containing protein [Gammaproteobacteria bacterium]|nr:HDOD domain-containing protein [Gammaproteobacteria bacterium]